VVAVSKLFVQSASVLSLRITRNYWPTSPVLLPELDFIAKIDFYHIL